jgi:hypothetical protein
MAASLELACNQEAIMFDVHVRIRNGGQQPPIVLVGVRGRLAKVVDFVNASELLQGGDRRVECARQLFGGRISVQHEIAEAFVGFLKIAVLMQLQKLIQ